jgi:transcriptional regulator with XRE-family HTH domain
MNILSDNRTVGEWEQRIGDQFRALRLAENIDRDALARRASVSVGAIANLETGKGSSLRTIIRIARALDRTGWLDDIADTNPAISPIEALRAARHAPRTRARATKKES